MRKAINGEKMLEQIINLKLKQGTIQKISETEYNELSMLKEYDPLVWFNYQSYKLLKNRDYKINFYYDIEKGFPFAIFYKNEVKK